jgi:hypothetical protein
MVGTRNGPRISRDPLALPTLRYEALLLRAAIAFLDQLVEFVGLLGDAVRGPLFVLAAAGSSRLFDQLSKVVSQDRNAIVEFREG